MARSDTDRLDALEAAIESGDIEIFDGRRGGLHLVYRPRTNEDDDRMDLPDQDCIRDAIDNFMDQKR